MSKSTTTDNDFLKYTFNKTAISWDSNTTLYVALHTADPTASGTQTTNEANYAGYSRVAVSRSSSEWAVASNSVSNVNAIQFPARTDAGTQNITHVSIGTAASGAGQVLYFGSLTSGTYPVTIGVSPKFLTGKLVVTET